MCTAPGLVVNIPSIPIDIVGASGEVSLQSQLLHNSMQKPADNLECLIPGCGQPVHVDAKGVKVSEYCSMRHRECVFCFPLFFPWVLS